MIRCHYIGTPLGAMTLPRPIRSLLVFAFAAWMSLCCCEKRILAHAFDSAPQSSVPSCCAEHCCADDASERDGDSNRDNRESHDSSQPRNCADGCCVKGATAAPVLNPACHRVISFNANRSDDQRCFRLVEQCFHCMLYALRIGHLGCMCCMRMRFMRIRSKWSR